MSLLVFLLLFPLATAGVLLFIRNDFLRAAVVKAAAFLIGLGSILFLAFNIRSGADFFDIRPGFIDAVMFVIEILIALYILCTGIRNKSFMVTVLIIVQTLAIITFRLIYGGGIRVEHAFFIDSLSLLMCVIVGVVAGLIAVYSIGYMRNYHAKYREIKDRRSFFFFVIFAFIAAMFGLVLSNNLVWIFFCWELTTLSSFLLIGYSRTDEARRNSLCALEYNLWGGVAMALAIVYLGHSSKVIELDRLMALGKAGIMVPVSLICFAGITKAAQYPFTKWLLGAMVAPTPVSALLHSSTMVKAGVYIILRFATVLEGTATGCLVAAVGGVTFLVGSLIAIAENDGKRVLAYSTVANLGLIILCAGIGSAEAMWAGILLIIFHAVTKGLLFLCIGVVDDRLGSRNIEDMSGLIVSMPKISIMMQVGIAGMFLAPFGMLISKWAVIRAILDSNPIFLIFIIFGGSATVLFWIKWMGSLVIDIEPERGLERDVGFDIWLPLYTLAFFTFLLVGLLPFISDTVVEPYLIEIYNQTVDMGHGNTVIVSIMLALILLFPLSFVEYGKGVKVVGPYLAGANVGEGFRYTGGFGRPVLMEMKGFHLEKYFGEGVLYKWGVILSIVLIAAVFGRLIIGCFPL